MSLDYYYQNKDDSYIRNRLHAKNYYERIKDTPIYYKKALLASIRFQIKSKTEIFSKTYIQILA
jgi:adenine-specific DNA methylase